MGFSLMQETLPHSATSWLNKLTYLRSMVHKGTVVLEHERIGYIIQRFAHRIYEDHHKEKEIVIVGILDNGFELANRMASHLSKISTQKISVLSLAMDKIKPLAKDMVYSEDTKLLKGKLVILVDDVLNSGTTLVHALSSLLHFNVKGVSTYVLVDRIHRRYPVKADHVGMSLSTTIKERVEVDFTGKETYAYLI